MHIRWYGQSAFLITATERAVFVDPFSLMVGMLGEGRRFDYPPIEDVEAELLLVTHEHPDHNAVEAVGGSPHILRSTAGTFESPIGEVIAIASEHDDTAGTQRGANTIICFALDGLRVCHFGDFGQAGLRPEQQRAIGEVDVLFLPVGGGPTVGGEPPPRSCALRPRLVADALRDRGRQLPRSSGRFSRCTGCPRRASHDERVRGRAFLGHREKNQPSCYSRSPLDRSVHAIGNEPRVLHRRGNRYRRSRRSCAHERRPPRRRARRAERDGRHGRSGTSPETLFAAGYAALLPVGARADRHRPQPRRDRLARDCTCWDRADPERRLRFVGRARSRRARDWSRTSS